MVASFEGGCPAGSRLGILCRQPLGWYPNLDGTRGDYLFLVDSHAQASVRGMRLGDGSLGVRLELARLDLSFLFFWEFR